MSVTELMADLTSLGIRLEAHGDRLRYSPQSAVTPELAERLKAHKPELLARLRTARPTDFDDELDPADVVPCPACGSLRRWWSVAEPEGPGHCLRCDPPRKALAWAERAQRLRRRYGLPDPPGSVEFIAGLRRLIEGGAGGQ